MAQKSSFLAQFHDFCYLYMVQFTLKNIFMDKGKFFSGLFIMFGLIILGSMLPKAVDKFGSFDRTVNVKGLCEMEVKADKVIWPVV